MKNRFKKPLCVVYWKDAAYTYEKKPPKFNPSTQATAGFIVYENKDTINVAMNVNYDEKTGDLWPVDGLAIPRKTIAKILNLKS